MADIVMRPVRATQVKSTKRSFMPRPMRRARAQTTNFVGTAGIWCWQMYTPINSATHRLTVRTAGQRTSRSERPRHASDFKLTRYRLASKLDKGHLRRR